MAQRLLLIDGSSSIYRAFYGLPAFSSSRGVPTHAALGFVTMLQKLIREEAPDFVVVVWDSPGPKRRKQMYPAYKANRDATPEDLRSQIPVIRRLVEAYRLCSMEYAGEEADDVIATLARQGESRELEVLIASTDRDLMQLVGQRVTLLDTMRDRRFGPEQVEERFGVAPDRMLDLRALTGDSSDNIPGVRGIGEKGAAKLIREHGSLDALLERAADLPSKRHREALLAGADSARLSRELSRLRDDLPLELDLDRTRIVEPDREALAELFRELEFSRLLEGLGDSAETAVPRPESAVVLVRDEQTLEALVARLMGSERLALGMVLEPEAPMLGELLGVALAESPDEAQFVAVAEIGEARALELMGPLLEREGRVWVGHELKRDWTVLARRGISLRGELRDVALAAYVVDPGQQVRRPELLARTYLGLELPAIEAAFGKGARRRPADSVPLGELAAFHAERAAASLPLGSAVEQRLEETGQLELFAELEVPLARVLGRMELAGVRIDESKLAALSQELEVELAAHEARIHELAGESFNIGSPKQLQKILFEKLGLRPTKRTKTGFSTDESVLEELSLNYELPGEVLEHRKLAKLKSTYVDALPRLVHPETGRIHCQLNQSVTATGRLSASNPNLQNIPVRTTHGQRIRDAFIPAEERLLVSADYSQIELRILAHLSADEALCSAFRSGEDVHVLTAAQVFGIPPAEVTASQRTQIKAINFGIIYGSSAFGIARQLGIPRDAAADQIRAYFERYPGVRAFLDRTIDLCRARGYAETLSGRRRYLPDLRSRNRTLRQAAERMATNSAIQGTAADLIKRAMVRLDAELAQPEAPQARMILQVHDELVFEVRPEDTARLEALVAEEMRGVAELSVPLEVHVGRGRSWLEAH